MGLSQGDADHRLSSNFRAWIWPLAVLAIGTLLALTGDWAREWLRYDRVTIGDGQIWRLVSGHLVHLGWSHFFLNGAGLLLIWFLMQERFSALQWLLIGLATVAGIDLGFWVLEPQLSWYVGLSGVLHGLLAAGAISGMKERLREFWVIAAFLVIKLAYEQLVGPLPGSEGASGGNVVVAAHLYGAIAGALAGGWLGFRKAPAAPI